VKVKGVITWVGVAEATPAEVRLYDRLFTDPQPDAGGKDFIESLNPSSLIRPTRRASRAARLDSGAAVNTVYYRYGGSVTKLPLARGAGLHSGQSYPSRFRK
jgi:hypothetical protein